MKRIAGIAAGILLFLAALILTLYPLISDYVNTKYQSEVHTAYEEAIAEVDDSALIQARERQTGTIRLCPPVLWMPSLRPHFIMRPRSTTSS